MCYTLITYILIYILIINNKDIIIYIIYNINIHRVSLSH